MLNRRVVTSTVTATYITHGYMLASMFIAVNVAMYLAQKQHEIAHTRHVNSFPIKCSGGW